MYDQHLWETSPTIVRDNYRKRVHSLFFSFFHFFKEYYRSCIVASTVLGMTFPLFFMIKLIHQILPKETWWPIYINKVAVFILVIADTFFFKLQMWVHKSIHFLSIHLEMHMHIYTYYFFNLIKSTIDHSKFSNQCGCTVRSYGCNIHLFTGDTLYIYIYFFLFGSRKCMEA